MNSQYQRDPKGCGGDDDSNLHAASRSQGNKPQRAKTSRHRSKANRCANSSECNTTECSNLSSFTEIRGQLTNDQYPLRLGVFGRLELFFRPNSHTSHVIPC